LVKQDIQPQKSNVNIKNEMQFRTAELHLMGQIPILINLPDKLVNIMSTEGSNCYRDDFFQTSDVDQF